MLQQTFLHFHGVGPKTEHKLWEHRIRDWNQLEEAWRTRVLPRERFAATLEAELAHSWENLESRNPGYFAGKLPAHQHWRLFAEFLPAAAYLDIETTGLGGPADHITTISLYDGKQLRYYIYGENLQEFIVDVKQYDLLITFNGKCFDLPFIQWQFNTRLTQAHLDLRFVLKALGYRGGLKACEKQLGISRGDLEGVDGYIAVLLWQEYRRSGDRRALETLLAYNMEDTVNLEKLAFQAYNEALGRTPFAGNQLPAPAPAVPLPFQPSRALLERCWKSLGRGRAAEIQG